MVGQAVPVMSIIMLDVPRPAAAVPRSIPPNGRSGGFEVETF
jgi:hypothetical protein